jgi:alpha-beta hydrolase superfamily lysophospholipase
LRHFDFTRQASDGLSLYFQGWEPENGPVAAVCLVHGLGEHTGRYAHVAAALTEAGYALLGFDLRGHGRSGGPRGHSPTRGAMFNDVDQLLAEAAARYPELPRFLYGHSMGGGRVLCHALGCCSPTNGHPDLAGVIATSPSLRTTTPQPGWKMAIGKVTYSLAPAMSMSNGLDRSGLSRDPQVVERYNSDPLVHDRVSARLGIDILRNGECALTRAGQFPVPLLLMHGSADRITSPQASREFAQRNDGKCMLKIWDGLYHEIHNEPESQEVLEYVIRWMDGQRSGGSQR